MSARPDWSSDPVVARHRAEIDAADDALLGALNRRLEAVRALHRHKRARGYPMFDGGREAMLAARLVEANRGPLGEAAVRTFVADVIALTGSEVRRLDGPT